MYQIQGKESDALTWLLYTVAINQIVSRESFFLQKITERDRYFEKIVINSIKSGFIKDNIEKLSNGKGRKTCHFYTITAPGMRYLCTRDKPFWLRCIDPAHLSKASLYGSRYKNKNQYRKTARISVTRLISEAAGADCEPFPFELSREDIPGIMETDATPGKCSADMYGDSFPDEDTPAENDASQTHRSTYMDILKEAMTSAGLPVNKGLADLTRNDLDRLPDGYIRYTESARAKAVALTGNNRIQRIYDYDRCQFDGIAESRHLFIMLYATVNIGKEWNLWTISQDLSIAQIWNSRYAITAVPKWQNEAEIFDGALFVENLIRFRKIYQDTAGIRKGNLSLGSGYKNFYLIPLNHDGSLHLRFLLSYTRHHIENAVVRVLSEKGYTLNNMFRPDIFLMKTDDGHYLINGIYMDIRRIQKYEKLTDFVTPVSKAGILCFMWQKPYYESILPGMEFVLISRKEISEKMESCHE